MEPLSRVFVIRVLVMSLKQLLKNLKENILKRHNIILSVLQ